VGILRLFLPWNQHVWLILIRTLYICVEYRSKMTRLDAHWLRNTGLQSLCFTSWAFKKTIMWNNYKFVFFLKKNWRTWEKFDQNSGTILLRKYHWNRGWIAKTKRSPRWRDIPMSGMWSNIQVKNTFLKQKYF